MLYITEEEVESTLTVKDLIPVMNDAFVRLGKGSASVSVRNRIHLGGSVLSTMPAAMEKPGIAGLKAYIAGRKGSNFVVILFDTDEMKLKAVVEANKLGQLRTGAVPAMVSREIVRKNRIVFSLIGSGYQAESQLEGIAAVFNLEEARVYSKHPEHARKFAERFSDRYEFPIRVYGSAGECVNGADIITCVTNSDVPIFGAGDLSDEFHINLVGGNIPSRREVTDDVLDMADLIVVENREQAMIESGEIISLGDRGSLKMVEIKDLFLRPEIKDGKKRTVLKTMGIGLEDIAAANYLLQKISQDING